MKIFNIGLNKAGTLSLANAMQILGYSSAHYKFIKGTKPEDAMSVHDIIGDSDIVLSIPNIMLDNYKANRKLMDGIVDVDFYADFCVNNTKFIPKLDIQYPDSKFIFTVREMNDWIDSTVRHVQRNLSNPNYTGTWTSIDIERHMDMRNKFEEYIYQYFSGRDCLLVMDICNGDGWEKLCKFLEKDIPSVDFPFKNKNGKFGQIK